MLIHTYRSFVKKPKLFYHLCKSKQEKVYLDTQQSVTRVFPPDLRLGQHNYDYVTLQSHSALIGRNSHTADQSGAEYSPSVIWALLMNMADFIDVVSG